MGGSLCESDGEKLNIIPSFSLQGLIKYVIFSGFRNEPDEHKRKRAASGSLQNLTALSVCGGGRRDRRHLVYFMCFY